MADNVDITVKVFGRTDVGIIRDHNEDNFGVINLSTGERSLKQSMRQHQLSEQGSLFMVCDGMGGAAAGEVASSIAVDSIYQRMMELPPALTRQDLASKILVSINYANSSILAEAQKDKSKHGMGTTCTLAALRDQILMVAQVGDSRAYLVRNKKIYQITTDQTLLNKLIEVGQIKEDEIQNFAHNHVILQALGVRNTVSPVLVAFELKKNDKILLCSDGLTDVLSNKEILDILLANNGNPVNACKQLTETANQKVTHDNVTVIVAEFDGKNLVSPSSVEQVEFVEIPKNEIMTHPLMSIKVPSPTNEREITQVFGSFTLDDIKGKK